MGAGHQSPALDFVMAAWTDGRWVTGTPTVESNWDAYCAPFTTAGELRAARLRVRAASITLPIVMRLRSSRTTTSTTRPGGSVIVRA